MFPFRNSSKKAATEADLQTDQEMSFFGHLRELRTRLIRALLAILVCFVALIYFANDIYTFVAEPLIRLLPQQSSMIAISVTSPFFAPFKLTLAVAFALAVPIILYQLWRFIAPGLYRTERRAVFPILLTSILLFYAGIAFAYFVVLPIIVGFFTSVGPQEVAVMTDIHAYLSFVLKLFFAFGIAFEIPIAMIILNLAGLLPAERIRHHRRYVIVACFVIAMLLTPPDIFSQSLLALPMWLLFECGLFFCTRLSRSKVIKKQLDASSSTLA